MKTYTQSRNLYGTLSSNTTTTNLSLGDQLINDNIRYLAQKFNFTETSKTDTTVANQQFYELPYNYKRLIDVTVTVGSNTYTPRPITSKAQWDTLNQSTAVTSTYPQYYYIYDNQVGFYPIPSASSNTITYNYKKRFKDLSQADYTTGTVSITTGTKTLTGVGTTWVAGMAGRWIQIAPPGGDNEWYEIASFTSTTSLTLVSNYNGATVAGGSYTIGEVSVLPEEFQDMPVLYALVQYYSSRVKDEGIYKMYKSIYDEKYTMMNNELGSKDDNMVINMGVEREIQNPNLFVSL